MVDVLAVQNRIGRRNAVPMHGQRHEHGVDALVTVQVAEVRVLLHVGAAIGFLDEAAGAVKVLLVDVADGDHPHIVLVEKVAHVMGALRADTDHSQGDLVGRSRLRPKHMRGNDPRRAASGQDLGNEGAAFHEG